MKYLAFSSLLLVVSLASTFNLRGPTNAALQRKHFLPVMPGLEKKEALSRIIDGASAISGYHYTVGLEFMSNVHGRGGFCGGVLIDNEWVLTAAHCTLAAHSVDVYLGMRDMGRATVHYLVYSNDIRPHGNFDESTYKADIAVVKIPYVHYNTVIQPAALPRRVRQITSYGGGSMIALGWGSTSPNENTLASTLQYITLIGISNEACERSYVSELIYRGKLCTSGNTGGATCKGDSGGPLVLRQTGKLIGIISFHSLTGCALGYPDVFTRVEYYLGWINQKTGISIPT